MGKVSLSAREANVAHVDVIFFYLIFRMCNNKTKEEVTDLVPALCGKSRGWEMKELFE